MQEISEKYRKYLLSSKYKNGSYYMVAGADLEQNEEDKVLISTDSKIMLFSNIMSIAEYVKNANSCFDHSNLIEWAEFLNTLSKPYAFINLDSIQKIDNFDDKENIDAIFFSLGIIKDYAHQVGNSDLLCVFNTKDLMRFNDCCLDFLVWKITSDFDIKKINISKLNASLDKIYKILHSCIFISH